LPSGRESFGPRLRAARERASITLDAIADSTKIQRSLLAGLENNDVSHWPKGIYRRGFLRDYLTAIGIAPEPVVAEFIRLFPEEGSPPAAGETSSDQPTELRLTFGDLPSPARRLCRRALAASVDLSAVATCGAVGWATGVGVPESAAAGAVVYFTVATIAWGQSAGAFLLVGRGRRKVDGGTELQATGALAREQLHIVARGQSDASRSQQPLSVDAGTAAPPRRRAATR
jgi:transcriptional regulator with XRE-family HTH domain